MTRRLTHVAMWTVQRSTSTRRAMSSRSERPRSPLVVTETFKVGDQSIGLDGISHILNDKERHDGS